MKKATFIVTTGLSLLLLNSVSAMETVAITNIYQSKQEIISLESLLKRLINQAERLYVDEEPLIIENESENMSLKTFLEGNPEKSYKKHYDERHKKAAKLESNLCLPSSQKKKNKKSNGAGAALFAAFKLVNPITIKTDTPTIYEKVKTLILTYLEALEKGNQPLQSTLAHEILELYTEALSTIVPGIKIALVNQTITNDEIAKDALVITQLGEQNYKKLESLDLEGGDSSSLASLLEDSDEAPYLQVNNKFTNDTITNDNTPKAILVITSSKLLRELDDNHAERPSSEGSENGSISTLETANEALSLKVDKSTVDNKVTVTTEKQVKTSTVLRFTDPINLDDDSQKECSIQ